MGIIDWFPKIGLQSSDIQRVFLNVRARINFSVNEFGYPFSNLFAGSYIAKEEAKEERHSERSNELQILSLSYREEDDELRHFCPFGKCGCTTERGHGFA